MVVFVLLLTYISTDAARLLYYWHLSHIRPTRYAQQIIKCSGYKNTNPPLVNSLRISTCLGVICWLFNTLRPTQNGRHFTDDIFKCIFLNEDMWISIDISLKFVPKDQINDNPALVQIMAWLRPGDKPLSEPVMVIYWRLCTSLSLNELTHWDPTKWLKVCRWLIQRHFWLMLEFRSKFHLSLSPKVELKMCQHCFR